MGRLSDHDIERLIGSLTVEPHDKRQPLSSNAAAAAIASPALSAQAGVLAARLQQMSADGELGPLLTQRLAAYVRLPLRCTSGAARESSGDGSWYVARSGDVDLWVRFDAMLAGALADAMIGGDGEAPKVGYGAKVARVAAGAAAQVLGALAAALRLPEPSSAAVDSETGREFAPVAGGEMTVASHPYAWSAGIAPAPERAAAANVAKTPSPAATTSLGHREAPSAALAPRDAEPGSAAAALPTALERSRIAFEEMLGAPVVFGAPEIRDALASGLPAGTLRVGSSLRSGGAIVLAIGRASAAALVNGCVRDDVAGEDRSEIADLGAETIVESGLAAFASAWDDSPGELQHVERLGDEAMLAELPHRRFDVRFSCGTRSGTLHWDVPEHRQPTRSAGAAARPVR